MITKAYIDPKMEFINFSNQDIVSSSNVYNVRYDCPYIPQMRCDYYNAWVHDEHNDKFYSNLNHICVSGSKPCPREAFCEKYARYKELNERYR